MERNTLLSLQLQIPVLTQQLEGVREVNRELLYSIQVFESSPSLYHFSRDPAYGHLREREEGQTVEIIVDGYVP